LLLATSLPSYANDSHQKRQRALESAIGDVVKEIEAEKNRYSDLQKKLADIERRVQSQASNIRRLDREIATNQSRLSRLENQQAEQQAALSAQQKLLAKQLRGAWMAGNQERLQLWLSGGDVKLFGPVITWYDYINKNRAGTVIDLANELEVLVQTEQQISQTSERLLTLRQQEARNIEQLSAARQQRRELLSSSQARITAEQNQLSKLKKEQAQLNALIERLKKLAAQAPPAPKIPAKPFAELTGKLHWPSKGKILHDYGSPRADGRLKWNGVTIKAKQGATVRAVANGEVIFADWLGRLGLLMIVDHGDNYLTLYGHNQALYKKPGEKVAAGDLIASVGNSGGRTESALYFEVRKGSNFRNPHQWCKKAAL
jgi:septal ring factor EnvC (AmiA/AmiB activator)